MKPTTVVFDIGNVLVAWDPRNLYRRYFKGREDEMEWFLANVCTSAWNVEQDRGRSFAEAVDLLVREHPPQWHPMIRAFDEEWHETISSPIAGSVEILRALKRNHVPVYAITNWNQDKFREAQARFDFLTSFDGIVVSGEERLLKPEPEIFTLFFKRYGVRPRRRCSSMIACAMLRARAPSACTGFTSRRPKRWAEICGRWAS